MADACMQRITRHNRRVGNGGHETPLWQHPRALPVAQAALPVETEQRSGMWHRQQVPRRGPRLAYRQACQNNVFQGLLASSCLRG